MRIHQLESDIRVFTGQVFDSNSTAIVNGKEAMLIDSLASTKDALELKQILDSDHLKVRWILCTHYFSDHMAALRLFPDASIVAQENYDDTFQSESFRTEEESGHFVEPNVIVRDSLQLKWGRYTVNYFANPGHTSCSVAIDVPEADVLFGADTTVGNIVYLNYGSPEKIEKALHILQQNRRGRFIAGHDGVQNPETVNHALHYLHALEAVVRRTRIQGQTLEAIPLNECLAPGIAGTDFETIYHKRNLESIQQRNLFAS